MARRRCVKDDRRLFSGVFFSVLAAACLFASGCARCLPSRSKTPVSKPPIPAAQKRAIRVAIYDDAGGSGKGPSNIEKCLSASGGFAFQRVNAQDIRQGILSRFDVLIQPGGSGSKQGQTLGLEGRRAVQRFVKGGGGYIGICAGAYLACSDRPAGLAILDARAIDRAHWARGTGNVKIKLTSAGKQILGTHEDIVTVYYGQGPLLAPDHKRLLPDFETLATYETEMAKKGAPSGVMIGTTAIAAGRYGKGRVLCLSPHPERTPGLDGFIRSAVRFSAMGAADGEVSRILSSPRG